MSLHFAGRSIPVLQASDSEIKLAEAQNVASGDAVLEIVVDGNSRQWPITVLSESSSPGWRSIIDRPAD